MTDWMENLVRKVALLAGERRAMESIARNAARYVEELRGCHPQLRDEDVARLAVHRVIAEAHAHPPANALRLQIDGRSHEAGSETGWIEDGLSIVLQWSNRADFAIRLENLKGAVSIIDSVGEETFTLGTNGHFEIPPRSEYRLRVVALRDCKVSRHTYEQVSVSGEAYVEALVAGPWPEGSHQVCRFNAARTWIPVRR